LRIGHLGSLNQRDVLATLAGVELALRGMPITLGVGAAACPAFLAGFPAGVPT
jgi:aspartate aminotransferase-like enzyme